MQLLSNQHSSWMLVAMQKSIPTDGNCTFPPRLVQPVCIEVLSVCLEEDVIAALVFLDGECFCMTLRPFSVNVTEILNLGIIDRKLIPSQYPLLSKHMDLVDTLRDQGLFD